MTDADFTSLYIASRHPDIAALRLQDYDSQNNPGAPQYSPANAKALLVKAMHSGYPIDYNIDMNGWDPQIVMLVRGQDGYAWVPAYGQPNINIAPGLSMPGVPSNYTTVAPAGSIKVSIDPKDYPPFITPVIILVSNTITVGPLEFSGVGPDGKFHYYFGVTPGDTSRIGTNVVQDGQNYTKVAYTSQGMPGFTTTMVLWQLNLPS